MGNGREVITGLTNSEVLKTDQHVVTKYLVTVQNQEGITVSYKARQGEAILKGIQRKKIR